MGAKKGINPIVLVALIVGAFLFVACIAVAFTGLPSPEERAVRDARREARDSARVAKAKAAAVPVRLPVAQTSVCAALLRGQDSYAAGGNDLIRSKARGDRRKAMADALKVDDVWFGTITELTTTSSGRAVVALSLVGCSDFTVGTARTEMSEALAAEPTLIEQDSELFGALTSMKVGDAVAFRMTPVPDPRGVDAMMDTSLTERGSMSAGRFVAKIRSVYPRYGMWAASSPQAIMTMGEGGTALIVVATDQGSGIAVAGAEAERASISVGEELAPLSPKAKKVNGSRMLFMPIDASAMHLLKLGQPWKLTLDSEATKYPPIPPELATVLRVRE